MEINIMQLLKDWGSHAIALVSLIVAIVSLVKSSKAQQLQNSVNELEYKLKTAEVEKMEAEKSEANRSMVEARIINVAKGSYRLKVWNSGNVTAYNVSADFADDTGVIIIDSKMPFEELEPKKNFEDILVVTLSSSRKFKVTTRWTDASGDEHSKTQMVDF